MCETHSFCDQCSALLACIPFMVHGPCVTGRLCSKLHRMRRLARAEKDIREGAEHARRLAAEYPWVASERQFFGRAGGDYDWGARDADAAFAELERAEETLGRLGKGLNKRVGCCSQPGMCGVCMRYRRAPGRARNVS